MAVALLAFSAAWYPGGYDWNRVTVSVLCAPTLPNGDINPVSGISAGGLLLLCASMALLFQLIAWDADTPTQRKTIQIAGIGAMVYAALAATPMHNLMVNISLAFFVVAMLAVLHLLYCRRFFPLFFLGLICLSVKITSASFYYTNAFSDFWGSIQKFAFALSTLWLFMVQFAVHTNQVTQENRTEAAQKNE